MTRDHPARLTPHLVFGLLIMAIGVLFTLDNLGLADADRYWRYWPIAVIALGAARVWQARSGRGSPVGGVFFLLVGGWFLLSNLGYLTREIWTFWPLLLVFIGSVIVWQGLRGPQLRAGADDVDVINAVAVMGAIKRGSNSAGFRGGELSAVMGGCEVDLRKAQIDGDAVVDVFAMWGGIEIRVPETWTVVTKVTPLMGGVEDHTRPPQALTTERLTVRGTVIMGGVEIKN